MDDKQKKLVFLAESVSISERDKLDPLFLTVTVKLCDSALNANREGTTKRFIEDVVTRAEDHEGLPFYADVDTLLAGDYEHLSHLYNKVLRTFGTNMIGSMRGFYSEEQDNVLSLYGKIRIPKRDREIVYRLVDLYEMGHFAVSVELSYDPREVVLQDGGKFIDASENSNLTGLCLVWQPACSSAYALDMVAEENADNLSEIVAVSEEQTGERGEEIQMKNENTMTAETVEEVKETEAVAEVEEKDEAIAETAPEEAAEEVVVAEDKPEEDGENPESDEEDKDKEMEDAVAETQEATAEVLEHSVDTHESVENWGGEPVHVIEYHERVIETMEDAGALIAELDTKIAELEEIKSKYDTIIAEQEAHELAGKKAKARAFAEKQGLDVTVADVKEAIDALDYAKIAELTMAQVHDEEPVEEEKAPAITLASFVEIEVSDDKYGGLLKPARK